MQSPLSFFDLPDALLSKVITEWLVLPDIAMLDSATCSSLRRPRYLLNVSHPIVGHSHLHHGSALQAGQHVHYVQWLFLRCVPVSRLNISSTYKVKCTTGTCKHTATP